MAFVTIHHAASGGTAQIDERTLPAWRTAGWSTARKAPRRRPTTTPTAAAVEDQDTALAGSSTDPTEE